MRKSYANLDLKKYPINSELFSHVKSTKSNFFQINTILEDEDIVQKYVKNFHQNIADEQSLDKMDIYSRDSVKLNFINIRDIPNYFKKNPVQIFKDKIEYNKWDDPSREKINWPQQFNDRRKKVFSLNKIKINEENHLAKDQLWQKRTSQIGFNTKMKVKENTLLGSIFTEYNNGNNNAGKSGSVQRDSLLQRNNSIVENISLNK